MPGRIKTPLQNGESSYENAGQIAHKKKGVLPCATINHRHFSDWQTIMAAFEIFLGLSYVQVGTDQAGFVFVGFARFSIKNTNLVAGHLFRIRIFAEDFYLTRVKPSEHVTTTLFLTCDML
jgi:hypothetical protein